MSGNTSLETSGMDSADLCCMSSMDLSTLIAMVEAGVILSLIIITAALLLVFLFMSPEVKETKEGRSSFFCYPNIHCGNLRAHFCPPTTKSFRNICENLFLKRLDTNQKPSILFISIVTQFEIEIKNQFTLFSLMKSPIFD